MKLVKTAKETLMPNDNFGWSSLMRPLAPADHALSAALLTTYDRADERFLAEEFLPALLRLGRTAAAVDERNLFLVELDRRLQELRDRIFIVSSTSQDSLIPLDSPTDPQKKDPRQAP